jgi:hypothetical protein
MTPCERKGYKAGQVFKVVENENNHSGLFRKDAIIVLHRDDGTGLPYFNCIYGANPSGSGGGRHGNIRLEKITRIYPPEEVIEITELDALRTMKAEIEAALSKVKALS